VRDGVENARAVDVLVPVIIPDNLEDIFDFYIRDKADTKPIVD
jgi:hypothetical protein